MSKITIYGKKSAVALKTIDNVEEHYCTNGMFYVKAEDQEFYFALESISMISVETEGEVKDIKWEFDSKDVLDRIRAEIKALPDRIWNSDVLDIIDKYKGSESE